MITNAISFDVEEYFQVTDFEGIVDKKICEPRLWTSMELVLGILAEAGVKATFFVLGSVAESCKDLIVKASSLGHEIACHGYGHKLIYNQSIQEFREDVFRTKNILEEITGKPVIGYRAPTFSIRKDTTWALDILAELGFKYDSSIFPILRKRYGIRNFSRAPLWIECSNGVKILEVPISTVRLGKVNIPFSGGGYMRLLPYKAVKFSIKRVNDNGGLPVIVYLHPWELDPDQPKIKAGFMSTFRHYCNIKSTKDKLTNLLKDFSFAPIREIMYNYSNLSTISTKGFGTD
jgi:polysaccharide deacetylase family protein (PEP-CTERM system associated)